MGCPAYVDLNFPLPNPEVQGLSFACDHMSDLQPYLFIIDKEGNVLGGDSYYDDEGKFYWGYAYHIDEEGKFNLTGDMGFYIHSKTGELFFYVGHFVNGKLQSIKRPNLIEFESPSLNPETHTLFYTEQLGSNNGTIYHISKEGRIFVSEITDGAGMQFHGDLTFVTAMRNFAYVNKYVANFVHGQLKSINKIEVIYDMGEIANKYNQRKKP